ncbi:MAG: DinB family protein [Capsulimonadaceae bacterium]|nr:DinB family protein [Capsulimonadaceae bacterium]
MPTVKELAAHLTRRATAELLRFVDATPADRITWKPAETGRPILEIVVECAGANYFHAKILATQAVPVRDQQEFAKFREENNTLEKAIASLKASTDAVVAQIDAFPEDRLDATIVMPFGPGVTRTFAEIMLNVFYHETYHTGQIAYIQTLYGDKKMP